MIRDARPDDVPALVEMGAQFHAESKWAASLAPFDPPSFEATVRHLGSQSGLVVAEEKGRPVGMIGATVSPLYFNASVNAAQEVFWYALPEHRKGVGMALLGALESKAITSRTRALIVAAMESLRGEAVGRAFERKGYAPVERMFAKVLP